MPRRPSTHVDDPHTVGTRLREAREKAGLTQRQLAFPGCTAAYISRIEAGARVPSYQILRELGKRLEVSADYLATGERETALGDPLFEAELAGRLGDKGAAEKTYRRVIDDGGPRDLVARAQAGLGLMAFEAGDHERAIGLLEQALAETPAGLETVVVADRLGRAYALTGRFDEALAVYNRYLADATKRGDPLDTVRFSVLLANTHIDRGDFSAAENVLSAVLDQAKAAVDPIARAGVYWAQSRLHSSQSDPGIASRYARLALMTLEQTEHTVYVAHALMLLATLENDQGNHADALALVDQASLVVRATGNRYDLGRLELEHARAEFGLGSKEEAASRALASVPLLADSSPTNAGRGYALAASVFRDLGDRVKAMELYELAAETFPAEDRHAADAYNALAEIAEESGDKDAALRYLKLALGAKNVTRSSFEP
jgi:tetratricopeptide (TPR) repeat protein